MANPSRLRTFIVSLAELIGQDPGEEAVFRQGGELLRQLVSTDDWLPDDFAKPDPKYYQQHLLYSDPLGRFSIVSFVWGPGQTTPIHDHTVWGMIGMLRGSEFSQSYEFADSGELRQVGELVYLHPGDVEFVSPRVGDLHKVSNAQADDVSISIHVYGANIGAVRRSVYAEDGSPKSFISGYSNSTLPNVWDLSRE
jgi:predicted metal-dependent enzyme (double-stranded beta helix superfamily)